MGPLGYSLRGLGRGSTFGKRERRPKAPPTGPRSYGRESAADSAPPSGHLAARTSSPDEQRSPLPPRGFMLPQDRSPTIQQQCPQNKARAVSLRDNHFTRDRLPSLRPATARRPPAPAALFSGPRRGAGPRSRVGPRHFCLSRSDAAYDCAAIFTWSADRVQALPLTCPCLKRTCTCPPAEM